MISSDSRQIPYAAEQGIFTGEQGIESLLGKMQG
jgi:hypothetical protein